MAAGCTHAVLESTGVYWKSVWHRLEESLTPVLANATAVRNLPGRKSDVSLVWPIIASALIPSPGGRVATRAVEPALAAAGAARRR